MGLAASWPNRSGKLTGTTGGKFILYCPDSAIANPHITLPILKRRFKCPMFFSHPKTPYALNGAASGHKWKVKKQCTTFFLANSRLQKTPHQPADVSRSRSSVLSDPTKTAQNSKPQATCPKMRFPHVCIGVKINSIVISAVVLSLLLPALFLYCCR